MQTKRYRKTKYQGQVQRSASQFGSPFFLHISLFYLKVLTTELIFHKAASLSSINFANWHYFLRFPSCLFYSSDFRVGKYFCCLFECLHISVSVCYLPTEVHFCEFCVDWSSSRGQLIVPSHQVIRAILLFDVSCLSPNMALIFLRYKLSSIKVTLLNLKCRKIHWTYNKGKLLVKPLSEVITQKCRKKTGLLQNYRVKYWTPTWEIKPLQGVSSSQMMHVLL